MPSTRSRRSVLAGVGALVGGCLGRPGGTGTPSGSASLTGTGTETDPATPSPTDGATDTPGTGTCCYHVITLTVTGITAADVAAGWTVAATELTGRQRDLVAAAAGGSASVEAWEGPPLEADTYVAYDGAYYRVEETTVDERTVTAYRFEAEVPARDDVPDDPLAYDDLTPEEARVVDAAVEGWEPGDSGYGRSYPVAFLEGSPDDCRFLDGRTHFVACRGTVVSLRHDDTGTATVVTYRYDLPRVATRTAAFQELAVRERVVDVTAADLPAAQREVAAALFADGHYRSDNPPSDPAKALTYWLSDHVSPLDGRIYARWEGDLYGVGVEKVVS